MPTDPPWREPVSVAEAKSRLGIRTDHRDDEIARLIKAARGQIETYTGRALVRRTFVEPVALDQKPVRISPVPVHSVTAFRYLDGAGDLVDLDDVPRVFRMAVGYCLFPASGTSWPGLGAEGYAEVEFVAGFGKGADGLPVDAEPVPDTLIQAMLLLVSNWFENHEGAVVGSGAVELPFGVRDLCRDFRPAGIL